MQSNTLVPVVYLPTCIHCKGILREESLVWSLGSPYHALVHESCAPFFDFSKGWPHALPYQYYAQKSRVNKVVGENNGHNCSSLPQQGNSRN